MRRRLAARPVALETIGVLLGSLALAILMTWPIATRIGSEAIGAGSGGDPLGYLWDIWYSATQQVDWWGAGNQSNIGAPFGRLVNAGANLLLLTSVGPAWIVAKIFSPIVAYNVNIITALTLTAASMYLLVRWLKLGRVAATWAAIAYTLFPYEILRANFHPPLAHIWCFPLIVVFGLRWIEKVTWGRGLTLTLGLAICWLTNPYYGLMGSLVLVVVVLLGLAVDRGAGFKAAGRRIATVGLPSLILIGVPLFVISRAVGSSVEVFHRSLIEIEVYGAHLSDYVRPPVNDPIATGLGLPTDWLAPAGERTNFLGWGTLPLFLVGLFLLFRSRRRIDRRLSLAVMLAVGIMAMGVVCSLASPYPIAGHRIPMPARLFFEFLPYLRVYARFVVVVTVGAIIVAAAGLFLLSAGRSAAFRVNAAAIPILASFAILPISGPLTGGVPGEIDGVSATHRPTWEWLRQHPAGTVLEAPSFPNEGLDRLFLWGQTVHRHTLANGSLVEPNRALDFLVSLGSDGRLDGRGIASRLRTVGVEYVAIEPWAYARVGLVSPNPTRPPQGYALEAAFPDGSGIWRITAGANAGVATFRRASWWDPVDDQGIVWRPTREVGVVTVYVPKSGHYTLKFRARTARRGIETPIQANGPGLQRRFSVRDDAASVALEVVLPAGATDVSLTNLGPTATHPAPGDLREVSFETTGWSVVPSSR